MAVIVDVAVANPQWIEAMESDAALEALANRAVRAALADEDISDEAEVSLLFTDDAQMRSLNKDHRDKDRSTNVLSFETGDPILLGDIVLAFETVKQEAMQQQKPFVAHLTHLVVHGALHLVGYDHMNEEDAEEMEGRERAILADLGIADPYAL